MLLHPVELGILLVADRLKDEEEAVRGIGGLY